MTNDVQLISDGDGRAVLGDPSAVEQFLASEGLTATTDVHLPAARSVMAAGSVTAQVASGLVAQSGRAAAPSAS